MPDKDLQVNQQSLYTQVDTPELYPQVPSKFPEMRRMKYGGRIKRSLGGLIGTAVGTVAGSVIPGVGTAIGAKVGGALGAGTESLFSKRRDKEPEVVNRGVGVLAGGGYLDSISNNMMFGQPVMFSGPSHEYGGIDIGEGYEVEGGETAQDIDGNGYVFSKRLKVPGSYKTFAQRHAELINSGVNPEEVRELMDLQERVSGRKREP